MQKLWLPLLLLLGLFISGQIVSAQTTEPKVQREMPDRWYQLMDLINKEVKTIQAIGELSPRLTQRLIELYTERLKLIKELENKRFLAANAQERKKGRAHFFKSSRQNQQQVEKMGLDVARRFPNFIGNSEIFHTLALNSRDYGDNKKTEIYLLNALKLAPVRSPVVYSAQVALAEHYYNDKQYKKALSYYNPVLKNTADEWYTKHLYNAAWCNLQTQEFSTAIDYLVRAHDLSTKYVNMKDQVLDSAGAFYVLADRSLEGAQFYLKNAAPPTDYLLKMARKISERGNFEDTKAVLDLTLEEARKRQDLTHQMDVHLVELDVYRGFKKNDLHFQTAQNIRDLHLKKPIVDKYFEDSVYKIKELVGYLQIRLSQNAKIRQENTDPALLKRIIDYFDILSVIDNQNQDEYHYFQGESYFSVSEYKDAAIVYQRALEVIKKKMAASSPEKPVEVSDPLKRKILDALLSVLEYGKLPEPLKTKVTLYSYTHYIGFWPVDEKSRLIYRSLFNLLFERAEFERAVKVMETYHKNYPLGEDLKTQQAMLTQLVDHSIKAKDTTKLAQWIARVNTGFLSFDAAFTEKATLVLGQLLFETFSALDQTGKKQDALNGYLNIYQDERYPQKIKADSSYAAALIYADIGDLQQSYQWMTTSFKHFEPAELFEKREALYALHEIYFLRQNHSLAITFGENIVQQFCQKEFKRKKQILSNIVYFSLLENQAEKAQKSLDLFTRCPLSLTDSKINKEAMVESLTQMVQFHLTHRQWNSFLKYVQTYSARQETPQALMNIMAKGVLAMYWDSHFTQDQRQQKVAYQYFANFEKADISKSMLKEIQTIKDFKEKFVQLTQFKLQDFSQTKPFDDVLFDKELEQKAAQVQEITAVAEELIKTGIPEIVLLSSEAIADIYQEFGSSIIEVHPQGMEQAFVDSFKNAMKSLGSGLIERGLAYQSQSKSLIGKNRTQTAHNHLLTYEKHLREKFRYRYMASELIAPQDYAEIGGQR